MSLETQIYQIIGQYIVETKYVSLDFLTQIAEDCIAYYDLFRAGEPLEQHTGSALFGKLNETFTILNPRDSFLQVLRLELVNLCDIGILYQVSDLTLEPTRRMFANL